MPDKLVVKKVTKEVQNKKIKRSQKWDCMEYSVFSLNPCPGDLDATLVDEACNFNNGICEGGPMEVLEVKPTDPLLELSNLTDDSKINGANASGGASMQSIGDPYSNQTPPAKTRQGRLFSIFDTTKNSRDISRSSFSTSDTLPLSKDGHRLDDIANDYKFLRKSPSELSIRIDAFTAKEFDTLVDCLYGNKDLTSVEVTRQRNISNQRCRTMAEVALLVTSLRSIPNLSKLILNCFDSSDIGMLCSLVKGTKRLEKFHLHFISGTVDTVFLNILAGVQSLKEISLDVQSSFPLYLLLASESIVRIAVPSESFSFKERHVVLTMQALTTNDNLRILDLKPKMSASDVRALSVALRRNVGLKILRFSFLADESHACSALQHLCESTASNTSLRTLVNYSAKLLRVPALDAYRMIKVLKSNESLTTYDLFDDETAEAEMINDDLSTVWESWFCAYDLETFSTQEPCQKIQHWNDSRHSDRSGSKLPSRALWTFPNWLEVWRY